MRITCLLSVGVVASYMLSAQDSPKTFKVEYGGGAFIFQEINWTVAPGDNSSPWFEGEILNKTGADWKDADFLLTITGSDNKRYRFEVPVSLGFHTGQKSGVTVANPYAPSALPIKSVDALLLHGTERKQMPSRLFSGPVVLQKDCLPDFVGTSSLSGLALRKKFAELIEFGCVEMAEDSYVGLAIQTAAVPTANGKSHIGFTEALLGSTDPSNTTTHSGWIQTDRIHDGVRLELVERGTKESSPK